VRFFSHPAPACTAALDPGLVGQHRGQCAATPVRIAGARVPGGLLAEALAVLVERAGHCRGSTRPRAIHYAGGPLSGKARPPCASGSIRQRERLRDVLQAPACEDFTDGVGATADARCLGLFQAGISGRPGVIGTVQCEGPHTGGLHNKVRQK
jgi:hypothetical protein